MLWIFTMVMVYWVGFLHFVASDRASDLIYLHS